MNALKLLDSPHSYALDLIPSLLNLYEYKGKGFYYRKILDKESKTITEKTIQKDAFYIAKIFDFNLTEQRLRLLIEKDLDAKNKEETLVKNIKKTLIHINNSIDVFEYNHVDILALSQGIYKDIEKINYITYIEEKSDGLLKKNERSSSAKLMDNLCVELIKRLDNLEKEKLLCIISFYIDFINTKCFKENNEFIAIFMIYLLLLKNGFLAINYESFFEELYMNKNEFFSCVNQANYSWSNGYPQVQGIHKCLINILTNCYLKFERYVNSYMVEKGNKKTDNLENIILKGPELFTKQDLRNKYPTISDSTLQRTLERMRDNGLIEALGTGRSARWRLVVKKEKKISEMQQTTLFDAMNDFNGF